MENEKRTFFSVGSALYEEPNPAATQIAHSINWLIQQQHSDGTWGSADSLDRFISTTHCVMTLMSVGFAPSSKKLNRALEYLSSLDKDTNLTFFYRSGPFLNLDSYRDLVAQDVEYLWKFRDRIGVHRDYPTIYFLLKVLKFAHPELHVGFTKSEVVRKIVDSWDEDECWYGRTSLTSMALALLFDEDFEDKQKILQTSTDFLVSRFESMPDGTGRFDSNIVDDSFTVYNLCERNLLTNPSFSVLLEPVERVVDRILAEVVEDLYWVSAPPFGGSVGDKVYPTAVVVRALNAFFALTSSNFLAQISTALLDADPTPNDSRNPEQLRSFWGKYDFPLLEEDICFVLMPFSPDKLTQIYERYVKRPIENATNLECVRADEHNKPTVIMSDVWSDLLRAKIVVTDLTNKNTNVYYELGMAHALNKKVILLAQSLDDLTFDLRGIRTIIYDDSPNGLDTLSERILKYVAEILDK